MEPGLEISLQIANGQYRIVRQLNTNKVLGLAENAINNGSSRWNIIFQICCEQVWGVGESLLWGVKMKEWHFVVTFLYLNLLIRERWRDCRLDLNMIKLLKPDVEISNLILRSCISGFRFLQITVFKRSAFPFSILYETCVLPQRKVHQIFVTTIFRKWSSFVTHM